MISRFAKKSFYVIAVIPLAISSIIYRQFFAPKEHNGQRVLVQLGPGQDNYLNGWVNVDSNIVSARIDVWANFANKIPFRSNSVDAFYSHHVIEHLPDELLAGHFAEMLRCLKPGGVIRVGGPNGDEAIRNFLSGNLQWFSDFPDAHRSIGGRFKNFLLCRGEHLTILTRSYLEEILEQAGFVAVDFREPIHDSAYPNVFTAAMLKEWEWTPLSPHTLIVEAVKPGRQHSR